MVMDASNVLISILVQNVTILTFILLLKSVFHNVQIIITLMKSLRSVYKSVHQAVTVMMFFINVSLVKIHAKLVHQALSVLHADKDIFMINWVVHVKLNAPKDTIKTVIGEFVRNVQIHVYNVLIVFSVFPVEKDFWMY